MMGAIARPSSKTDIAETNTAETSPTETDSPETATEGENPFLRPEAACPSDLALVTEGLMRDLPGYANRVARRSLGVREEDSGLGTILFAGQADLAPLDISPLTFSDAGGISEDTVRQVFFTTLERQYSDTDFVNLEHYHWLFLTEAEDGWRMVLLFSRLTVDEPSIRPPTPARESSDGIIGQAVRLWLRDCRAGAVYPIGGDAESDIGR